MMTKTSCLATLACLLAVLATVDTASAYDAAGPWTKVTHIYSRASGIRPFIYVESGGMPGCYDNRGGYLGVSTDDIDQAYSTLLSALMADREVQILYNYSGATSGWSMCDIEAIYIR